MPKDILLYGYISQYNAMFFQSQLNEIDEKTPNAELRLLVNTEGGEPAYGTSVCAKIQDLEDRIRVVAESQVHSFGMFILAYTPVDKVECYDITRGILHRAAYPDWFEKDTRYFTPELQADLTKTNKDMEAAFRARVNVAVLEALPQMKQKNLTLKDIFSMEKREEVLLSARDLKAIGLVSKINKITPTKKAQITAALDAFKHSHSLAEYRAAASHIEKQNDNKMTLEELKAQHPELVAQITAEAKAPAAPAPAPTVAPATMSAEEAIKKERERVKAWQAWDKVDPEAVKKGIADGSDVTPAVISEMSVKALAMAGVKALQTDSTKKDVDGNPNPNPTAPTAETEKEKELTAFLTKAKALANNKPVESAEPKK